MNESKNQKNLPHAERHDRLLHERVHDPYKSKSKLPEPTVCPDCGAIFHSGRWQWGEKPTGAHETPCPACHRIRDRVPAGYVSLNGDFLTAHKDEILNLIRNTEARAKQQHPMERIMACEDQEDGVLVTFTDAHLARGVGEAIHHAFKGELDLQYGDEDVTLRVYWRR